MKHAPMHKLLIMLLIFVAGSAWPFPASAPAAIKVGEIAPALMLEDEAGNPQPMLKEVNPDDEATSAVTMLLFVKPDDRYASGTIAALNEIFARQPKLASKLDRVIVVTRINGFDKTTLPSHLDRKSWRVLHDTRDRAYAGYKIIATPTIIIVTPDGKVAAVHAGYDAGMPQKLRIALSELQGIALPRAATEAPEKPNMTLQMARQMAKRGLWERAIQYYEKAGADGTLPPSVSLEMAAVYLELNNFEAARKLIESAPPGPEMEELAARLAKLQQNREETPVPPKVNR